MTVLAAFLVSTLYSLVPPGRWRTDRQVDGLRAARDHRGVPALPRAGPPDRHPRRHRPRRRRAAGRVPAAHAQRRLPRAVQPGPSRAPRRLRGSRRRHRPRAAGPAGRPRHRRHTVRPGRFRRLDAAEDHGEGRQRRRGRGELHLRQALRGHPRPLRPLVQARARAALRPARGREAVPHRPTAGAVRGLHPAAVLRRRPAGAAPARHRRDHPGARVPAGHRVHRRREGGRRRRDRRLDHRPGAVDRAPDVGDRHGPPRHQAGQPARPRRRRCSSSTRPSPRCAPARGGRRSTWPT